MAPLLFIYFHLNFQWSFETWKTFALWLLLFGQVIAGLIQWFELDKQTKFRMELLLLYLPLLFSKWDTCKTFYYGSDVLILFPCLKKVWPKNLHGCIKEVSKVDPDCSGVLLSFLTLTWSIKWNNEGKRLVLKDHIRGAQFIFDSVWKHLLKPWVSV